MRLSLESWARPIAGLLALTLALAGVSPVAAAEPVAPQATTLAASANATVAAMPLTPAVLAQATPAAQAAATTDTGKGFFKTSAGKIALDWGMAENLAYASLVDEGHPVRLSGQDCGRGTFAHRHAVMHDQNREKWDSGTYLPLQHIREGQANFLVIDSLLSEEAVLGFEYGYATAHPFELVIWEGAGSGAALDRV